ncbi:DNA-formamidopyrimidine glycosylase family protein [Saccharopolyspora hirsuta]|uniref:Fpg/Nei family DNA glycosylase n=1 Tax=Saccharopolyspora hirsuta TaxID=1837 RepID=A0A5M7BK15_SACHI|nr:DNA-formamidopyrimidine glycosylase family protein [Saccharopolyspora hirsuta]KAA5830042.1 Fpg/Nei family DNA glycosylase [Saccharopolyspora hirsuta]
MPELPDVEGFRRVAQRAEGRQVRGVQVRDAQVLRGVGSAEFQEALRRRYFGEPWRCGKWLVIPTAGAPNAEPGAPAVLAHFGMTGSFEWCGHGGEVHRHDRVVFDFAPGELRYHDMRKLTGLHLARQRGEVDELLAELGPDAQRIGAEEFGERLTRTRRGIKAALMDQSVLAGLGNICADELLWRARVHPNRATTELTADDLDQLHREMRAMLRDAVRAGRVPDDASWLTGHRDAPDQRCPRCSTALRRTRVGGRGTLWCPACQSD